MKTTKNAKLTLNKSTLTKVEKNVYGGGCGSAHCGTCSCAEHCDTKPPQREKIGTGN